MCLVTMEISHVHWRLPSSSELATGRVISPKIKLQMRPIFVCVLLLSVLFYELMQRDINLSFMFNKNNFLLHKKITASCYGTLKDLRRAAQQGQFQVRYHFHLKKKHENRRRCFDRRLCDGIVQPFPASSIHKVPLLFTGVYRQACI